MFFNQKNAILAVVILVLACVSALSLFFLDINLNSQKESATSNHSTSSENETTTKTSVTSSSIEKLPTVEEQLKGLLNNMSLEQKIGQLFLARVPESNQLEDIKTYFLGGYLLFGRDFVDEDKTSLKAKTDSYRDASDFPFLVASDEEGGTVTRMSQNENIVPKRFESPQTIYQRDGFEGIVKDVDYKASIFKEVGINTGLYPVADVSTTPESFIYDRTIGLDVSGTSEYVTTVVKEMTNQSTGSTLKHFPGYGENKDSHTDIVRDTRSLEDINNNSIPPFKAGIEAGVDSILVSHNIVEAIDSDRPASISPKIHQMLRDDLHFDGVIMTDDMNMAGLADFTSQEQGALEALKSGNDLILSSTYQTQIPVIHQAVLSGEYSEDELNKSVLRILKWKHKLGIIKLEEL